MTKTRQNENENFQTMTNRDDLSSFLSISTLHLTLKLAN
jgi:hypothetical protein